MKYSSKTQLWSGLWKEDTGHSDEEILEKASATFLSRNPEYVIKRSLLERREGKVMFKLYVEPNG